MVTLSSVVNTWFKRELLINIVDNGLIIESSMSLLTLGKSAKQMPKQSKHKYSKNRSNVSDETKEEAMAVAKATQRPGQTKEQTKLIAQGIQKGIDHYKKQQKSKARELDKKLKQVKSAPQEVEVQTTEVVRYQQHWLPWSLLVLSWLGFIVFQMRDNL